jgi:hypothetical protein
VSVTRHEGFCANSTSPDDTSDDFTFDLSTDATMVVSPVVAGKGVTSFYCRDFAGKCRVKVEFYGVGGTAGTAQHTLWLDIPRDADSDGISDQWEENSVGEWNAQYGDSETMGNGFFTATDDKEKKDPDGSGALGAHATDGDALTVWEEYRGFVFDGPADWGGTVGHKRLSPARKNLLVQVEHMGGFTGAATKAEVVGVMSSVKQIYLNSTGIQVDYATDGHDLPYQNLNTPVPGGGEESFLTARKPYQGRYGIKYDKYQYIAFVNARSGSSVNGVWYEGRRGGLVYCSFIRSHVEMLAPLSLGITAEKAMAANVSHELAHGLRAKDHQSYHQGLNVQYMNLGSGEDVQINDYDSTLTLPVAPNSSAVPWTISLLDPTADTFAELATKINTLPLGNYSATVSAGSGSLYSFTIHPLESPIGLGVINGWRLPYLGPADPGPSEVRTIWRYRDCSIMESPANKLMVYLSPRFESDAAASVYNYEVKLMDCANKQ